MAEFSGQVLSLSTGWSGHGGHTFNRRLCESLAVIGYNVTARAMAPASVSEAHPRLRVQALAPIPGIDSRGQMLRTDQLPRNVEVIIGHGRWTGGAAGYLRDQYYPNAKVVHVVHALADELDRWRGDPQQSTDHARTERQLIARADLVVGVGPLLYDDAARMAQMNERPPAVHEMIPGVDLGTPPTWRPEQNRVNLLLFGRVDDPLKGADTAAAAAHLLYDRGYSLQLTTLGADPATLREQQKLFSTQAGFPVKVKPFTGDRAEILAELRGADLVLMPSRAEGFGLVATEAAGLGVPVLVAGSSGAGMFFGDTRRIPEHLGASCVVPMLGTESDLPQRWAHSIERVLQDLPAVRQRAADLRGYLAQNFSWEHAARGLGEALHAVPARSTIEAQLTRSSQVAAAAFLPFRGAAPASTVNALPRKATPTSQRRDAER